MGSLLTKAAFLFPGWQRPALISTVLSLSLSISLFFFFLTKQILNKATAADMQMQRGRIAASKGVKIVRQRDVLARVALWRTAETHPQGRKREEGDGGYWLARFAVCPADFYFMARESQSPLGVYNPLPPPSPLSHCPYHIILLVSLDVWLLSLVYNDPSMWGFSRSQTVAPLRTSQFATGSHPPISPL